MLNIKQFHITNILFMRQENWSLKLRGQGRGGGSEGKQWWLSGTAVKNTTSDACILSLIHGSASNQASC